MLGHEHKRSQPRRSFPGKRPPLASAPSREGEAAGGRGPGTGMPVAPSHGFPFSQKAWKPKVKEVGGNSALPSRKRSE